MSETVDIVLGAIGTPGTAEVINEVPGVGRVLTPAPSDVAAALNDAPILVTFQWSDDWLAPGLQWIQSYSAGVEQFPVDRLAEAGVVLTSAVGIHDVQVSEHAFGLLLGMTRGIAPAARQQSTHTWKWPRVTDLADKTIGILGLGVIGEAIARKALAFGMTVIGTKRSPAGYVGCASEVFGPEDTLEVFRRSDVVVSVLPDTLATRGVVGSAEFDALTGGYFINVGRGSVVDEAALVAALQAGELAGAGLDVFEQEPLAGDSLLWNLPGVVITPHVAGASPRYAERLAVLLERNLAAYRGTDAWINRVV